MCFNFCLGIFFCISNQKFIYLKSKCTHHIRCAKTERNTFEKKKNNINTKETNICSAIQKNLSSSDEVYKKNADLSFVHIQELAGF